MRTFIFVLALPPWTYRAARLASYSYASHTPRHHATFPPYYLYAAPPAFPAVPYPYLARALAPGCVSREERRLVGPLHSGGIMFRKTLIPMPFVYPPSPSMVKKNTLPQCISWCSIYLPRFTRKVFFYTSWRFALLLLHLRHSPFSAPYSVLPNYSPGTCRQVPKIHSATYFSYGGCRPIPFRYLTPTHRAPRY